MNKQELIEEIKGLKYHNASKRLWVDRGLVLDLVEKLDEPNKPVVPQFVAEKIKYFKKTGDWNLFQAMDYLYGEKEIREWLEVKNNQETFARAWLDGYEVEKEKIYTVKVKAVLGQYLGRYYLNNEELTPQFTRTQYTAKEGYPTFTRSELEQAGFGWVFDCPGMKVKEVE